MENRTFEIRYCLKEGQNICVEVTTRQGEAQAVKRCLYQEENCPPCPLAASCPAHNNT
ncbi:MAG TPA: hypothetical protein IAB51_08495 [Candidatus Merdivicinus excrementipullorum]|uniref:Uncharacterized protein n=1 Tax=Candidatus Merdivicinus excrementipullorum TaxID=2840867 RepID=A0A9D1FNA6_9FIRM|nr:hypothetical protein [Candidatus Merdivicinus excrementipullorum]